jgi:hypothetical protein
MNRCSAWCLLLLLVFSPALRADTITQTTAEGRVITVQQQAIVVTNDSSFIVYKHFDLPEMRVDKVRLNKGSLPYQVTVSSPEMRKQIVEVWRKFGYQTTVTDAAGKITKVADAYVDFFPPEGRGSLLESIPPRTSIPMLLDGGGADQVEFSKITTIAFQGDHLQVTMKDGKVMAGKFLMPTNKPAEARWMGITDRYDPASPEVYDFAVPLGKLRFVRFD